MTRMDMELRDEIDAAVDWFRRSFSEFQGAYLLDSAVEVGVRSGRLIAQCMATGVNAALAAEADSGVEDVGYEAVRDLLIDQGAILNL